VTTEQPASAAVIGVDIGGTGIKGAPVSIELPPRAILEVMETEPTVKGQTAASSYKPALLSNGVRTMVPPFVTIGTKIVVATVDGSYVERAKE